MPGSPVAVIDIGSNSARLVVFRQGAGGVLDVVVDEHASLKLLRGIGEDGKLRDDAMDKALVLLADFRRLADSAGARTIRALGTSALRDAKNGKTFLVRAKKESGVRIEILEGREEGRAGFVGAVYGLPVHDGLAFDIGGGSAQLMHFRGRRLQRAASLPLGALRVSDEFLRDDPPSPTQVRKLRAHVHRLLRSARIGKLPEGSSVVGTGGTVRNLAKVDTRRFGYAIPRLHGYNLTHARLRELVTLLLGRDSRGRADLPGLNRSRADSIVGGAIVASSILEACGASHFLVAGQGLREGIVLAKSRAALPDPVRVRAASIAAFTSRFTTCDARRARRRTALALSLYDELEPYPETTWREMLLHAAAVLDAGRSIDYYKLEAHTAAMLRASGLAGFSHRGIGLVSSIIECADPEGWDPKLCSPPLHEDDFDAVERAGILLRLAEEIEKRRERGATAPVRSRTTGREFVLREPGMKAWKDSDFSKRFKEAFGKDLAVSA